jgi:hypothetical protein
LQEKLFLQSKRVRKSKIFYRRKNLNGTTMVSCTYSSP